MEPAPSASPVASASPTRPADVRRASLERPVPGSFTVREGRDLYLAENGFSVESYDEPTTKATMLGIRFSVPNTPTHRWAIMLHDLHHVATGFGTDFTGETEVSAWECPQGLRPLGLYTGGLVLNLAMLGFVFSPRCARAAWRASKAPNLFHRPEHSYEDLLEMRVGDLRRMLGLPEDGLWPRPRRLHAHAPAR
jgi:hypothetical protein